MGRMSRSTKMALTVVLFCLHFYLFVADAVNPTCECIIFESVEKAQGIFHSPNYPTPYRNSINCLLYTFMGDVDEIIELTFEEFDVERNEKNTRCDDADFVKMFLSLERPEVNELSQWDLSLCGKLREIEKVYFSSGPSLVLEFHTDDKNTAVEDPKGFQGMFRFLDKKLFKTDGEKIQATECDYQFDNNNKTIFKGKFYSPRYPSKFPINIQCHYRFLGRDNERVKIIFEKVHLHKGDNSCLNSPSNIKVYDGRYQDSPVIGQICDSLTKTELVSTGPDMLIKFDAGNDNKGQGFEASFEFEDESLISSELSSTEPDDTESKKTSTEPPVMECDRLFNSDSAKNGTFSSPNYPNNYPSNIVCTYTFTGRGKERVQIIFTDFDLFHPKGNEENNDKSPQFISCQDVDSVQIYIMSNGEKAKIDDFCGSTIPKQIMSNGPSMSLIFKSYNSGSVRGFQAIYNFVTNFGITTGRQTNSEVCGFVYNSSVTQLGYIMSPNHPGLYPRDTECHYFFYGADKEKVEIQFAYFDVEGVTPCDAKTESDYVEFSNFRAVDRKLPRFCNPRNPGRVDSDGVFFRVTFKSNSIFDGTGFKAQYQFITTDEPYTAVKRVTSSVAIHHYSKSQLHSTIVIVVLLAFFVAFL